MVQAVCDDWAAWLHSLPHASPAATEKDLRVLKTAAPWDLGDARIELVRRPKEETLPAPDREAAAGAFGRALGLSLAGSWGTDRSALRALASLLRSPAKTVRDAAWEGCRGVFPNSVEFRPRSDAEQLAYAILEWTDGINPDLPK